MQELSQTLQLRVTGSRHGYRYRVTKELELLVHVVVVIVLVVVVAGRGETVYVIALSDCELSYNHEYCVHIIQLL